MHEVGHSYTLSHTPTGKNHSQNILIRITVHVIIYRCHESRLQ